MYRSLWGSRKGISTIVAEVLMLLIVIIMSGIVFVWVVPYFNSQTTTDNATAAYAEKFQTVWGNFATFAPSIPETVTQCTNVPASGLCPLANPKVNCPGTISTATANNIYVQPGHSCLITANVGSVLADYYSNLTIIGATVTGGLVANFSSSVTLTNVKITGFTGLLNVGVISVTGTQFDTSHTTTWCADGCDMAIYEGGPGDFSFTNNIVNGQIESEVSSHAVVNNNTVTGRLEVESASYGQLMNNKAGMLDLDQNGVLVISGNTVYGNDPYFPGNSNCASGTATAICYGTNRWCATGNNVVISGSHNEAVCIGNIEVDLINTGTISVTLANAFMTGIPVSGPVSWKLTSGGTLHSGLPITIPVGQSANVTMQWTPPSTAFQMPWAGLYFIFVSSNSNYVDGYLYFGHNPALTIQSQSRLENRTCPPCY